MGYDLSIFWVWLALAALLGMVVGYHTAPRQTETWLSGWFKWGILGFFAGVMVALFAVIPGRFGLAFELALLFFAAYIIGGYIGTLIYRSLKRQNDQQLQTIVPLPVALSQAQDLAHSDVSSSRPDAIAVIAQKIPSQQPDAVTATKGSIAPASALASATPLEVSPVADIKNNLAARVDPPVQNSSKVEQSTASFAEIGHSDLLPGGQTGADYGLSDDLTLVSGVSKQDQVWLNQHGIFHFFQIAAWTPQACIAVAKRAKGLTAEKITGWQAEAEKLHALSSDHAVSLAEAGDEAHLPAVAAADSSASGPLHASSSNTSSVEPAPAVPPQTKTEAPHDTALLSAAGEDNRPPALEKPADRLDNLKWIKGIGPKNEVILHSLGIYQFAQIAQWNDPQQQWVGDFMTFPGRVKREHWVDQAKILCMGLQTDYSLAVKTGAITVDEQADALLDAAEAEALKSSLPQLAAKVEGEDKHAGSRPPGLQSPTSGTGDKLQRISGIGPQNETRLNALGIYYFSQIAAWTSQNVQWVGSYLAFPGRIDRERWIEQAGLLAEGKDASNVRRQERKI